MPESDFKPLYLSVSCTVDFCAVNAKSEQIDNLWFASCNFTGLLLVLVLNGTVFPEWPASEPACE
jgi:hypothetical protein